MKTPWRLQRQLTGMLLNGGYARQCLSVDNMADAQKIMLERHIEILFIRIIHWDKYRGTIPLLSHPPGVIVFLSGRMEKCSLRTFERSGLPPAASIFRP